MLTPLEIESADSDFDNVTKLALQTLVRNSIRYKSNPQLFADFNTRLEAIDASIDPKDTIKVQQINAMFAKITELGAVDVSFLGGGGEEAMRYSQAENRENMINYIIAVLYSVSEGIVSYYDEDTIVVTTFGGYGVAQRDVKGDFL
jgi:hypothetical protein